MKRKLPKIKSKLPRKMKKAARSIYTVYTPEVVEEKSSIDECSTIINNKIEYKTKTGRMTNTMLSVIQKMKYQSSKGILKFARDTERRIDFRGIINDFTPVLKVERRPIEIKPSIQDKFKKVTFSNGVTMTFLPFHDPTQQGKSINISQF